MEESDVFDDVEEESPEEKKKTDEEVKEKAEADKVLKIKMQTKKFFLAQIWIKNLLPLLEFFIDIKLFDDSYTSHDMVGEFALLIEATFDAKNRNIQFPLKQDYVKIAKENGYAGGRAKKMSNLCRTSILKIIDIFDSNQLFRLTPSK